MNATVARHAVGWLLLSLAPTWAAAETFQQMHKAATNNAQDCVKHWQGVSLPLFTNQRNVAIVCHRRFVLLHSNNARSPIWVIERLDNRTLKPDGAARPEKGFVQEERVPKPGRARDDDYEGNAYGLARGHMAPSEDFNNDTEEMKSSFILSNAIPQIGPGFNGSVWKRLEEKVRDAVLRGAGFRELYVITGPVHRFRNTRARSIIKSRSCGEEFELKGPPQARICKGKNKQKNPACGTAGVAIPIAAYKIVYDPQTGDAHAFVLANKDHDSPEGTLPYIEKHRVMAATIERITGIRFFRGLAADKRKKAGECAAQPLWGP